MLSLSNKRLTLAASCVIASLWFSPVNAQVSPSPAELTAQKEQHLKTIRNAQEELVSVREKIKESEGQLKTLREDLSARQVQLAGLKRELGDAPNPTNERVLANEARRVTMAELAVKAREASLERLEAKQNELEQQISAAQAAVTRTDRRLQNAARAAEDAKRQAAAEAAQELAEQQRLEAEAAERAQEEQRKAEEAARIAAEQEKAANERLEAEKAAAAAAAAAATTAAPAAEPVRDSGKKPAPRPQKPAKNERLRPGEQPPDMSLVVLEGEEPIYSGDDGGQVIMRSRSIPEPLVMMEVSPEQFSGEVEVTPGRAYFDIGARRYRGIFADQPGNNRYRFHYDRTDPLKPTLRIFKN